MADYLTLAHTPHELSIDLFTAIGGLFNAALAETGTLLLSKATQGAGGVTSSIVLDSDLTQRQIAAALNHAAGQVRGDDAAAAAELAADEPDDGLRMGTVRATDDGVSLGLSDTPDGLIRDLAARLAAAMLPAMEHHGAGNYLAWDFQDADQPWKRWELVIRRPDGLTPHQARKRYQDALEEIAARGKGGPHAVAQEALDDVRESKVVSRG